MIQTMTSTRPLLLATAGHIDHGKSTFVRHLTGTDPDRLPIEKSSGMTTDLGFAFAPGLAFLDCPGHESYIQHALTGFSVVDGVCLIIDATKGPQEQTFEHLFAISGIRVPQVLVVLSHGDKVLKDQEQNLIEKTEQQVRQFFNYDVSIQTTIWSPKTDQSQIYSKLLNFFKPTLKFKDGPLRFFIDRSFSLPGVGPVFTGTHIQGTVKRHDHVQLWLSSKHPTKKIQIKSINREGKPLTESPNFPSRLALSHDFTVPAEVRRGSLLLSPEIGFNNSALGRTRFRTKDIDGKRLLAQIRTLQIPVQVYVLESEVVRLKFPYPIPILNQDQVFLRFPDRKPGLGHLAAVVDLFEIYTKERSQPKNRNRDIKPNKSSARPEADSRIEKLINDSGRWDLLLAGDDLIKARALSKENRVIEVKDGQFLSVNQFCLLQGWLIEHFSKSKELSISDVKDKFGISRQHAVRILEFCDRHYWTFRKGSSRTAFKLPSSFRPAVLPPKHEHEREKHSDSRGHSC
ncbi:MAG: SelB C-terminal domain-containing protein [Oligoflexia bacterium]|nr:SelB C-terminal domain-containing protein [Oligoflexia bacterium]